MIKHRLDRLPVLVVTAGVVLAFVPFFVPLSTATLIALIVTSIVLRSVAPVHQHCHAHLKLFRLPVLNHLYDAVLVLAAGNVTPIWELQHVRGHHRAILEPENDPAFVGRFGGPGPFQRLIFTIAGDFLSFTDSLRIARRQRDARRMVARLIGHQTLAIAAFAALLAWDPTLALAIFVVPNILLRWFVFWFSYSQHEGVPGHDVYSSANTHFGWTNVLFLNVGHHTAHHEKPTLHWSHLPDRTRTILDRIPQQCLRS